MTEYKRIAAELTGYQRDVLWAVYRANQTHSLPVGADVQDELEAFGRTNTQGGQFYPRLNELVDNGLVAKDTHPDDERGFTCQLTDDGKAVLTQLFLRGAEALDCDVPECALPANHPQTRRTRGESA